MYRTICLVNGKQYVGKHKTKDLEDGYLGSGKLLRAAIKKHGIENFKREVIKLCESEEEMNQLERELVVLNPEVSYNLCPGGQGGFGYLNKLERNKKWREAISRSLSGRKVKCTEKQLLALRLPKRRPTKLSQKHKNNISLSIKEQWRINPIDRAGIKNSQYGTCWITNGTENKKIKRKDIAQYVLLGYKQGRINGQTRV